MIDKDTITCNAAIRACEQWGEALALWSSMAEGVVDENTITCNAAVSACEQRGRWGEALALRSSMAITCNAAISACGQPALFIFRIARS